MFGRAARRRGARAATARRQADGDPAFERARRAGRFDGRRRCVPARARRPAHPALRRQPDGGAAPRARTSFCPSALPARARARLGGRARAGRVMPNPVPRCPSSRRARSSRRLGFDGPDARLRRPADGPEGARRRARSARARRGVALLVAGDGPERAALERDAAARARPAASACSARCRVSEVLELFRAADAALLSSTLGELPAHASSRRSPSARR